jgi:predicted Zn-dependent protease
MISTSYFDNRLQHIMKKNRIIVGTAIAGLLWLAAVSTPVEAHPDLLGQIEALTTQIEANPDNAELLVKRSDLYRRHEDYAASAIDIAGARKLAPDNTLIDFYEGRMLYESGDPAGAEGLIAQYLVNHPRHVEAWVLRGNANTRLRQPEAASNYYAMALLIGDKPSPEVYRLNILSLTASGESTWVRARQLVDDGLQNFPAEVTLLGLGTDIALAVNRPRDAAEYLSVLPDALLELPEWQERSALAGCLKSPASDIQSPCLDEARENLAGQVEVFVLAP